MKLDTIELRWFFDSAPEPLRAACRGADQRTDWYAPLADARHSVKFRDGRLESKFLVRNLKIASTAAATGRMQKWTKLSLPLSDDQQRWFAQWTHRQWLAVSKRRSMSYFDWNGERIRRAASASDEACQVEWTEVVCRDRTWWTLGLEAAADLGENLPRQTLAAIAHEYRPLELTLARSLAYPEWLEFIRPA